MYLDWMGEYRELVESIIGVVNIYNQIQNERVFTGGIEGLRLSATEVQVIEYILENEEKNSNMSEIAKRLSISQSSFSKKIKLLADKGLLEKYYASNNRKNIIVKVSEFGKAFYSGYVKSEQTDIWREIFSKLDQADRESIKIFTDSLIALRQSMIRTLEKEVVTGNLGVELIKLN